MKKTLNKYLSKSYDDEIHILDGIIISLLMIIFITSNFYTLVNIYLIDLILLLLMLLTVFLITVITIKNAITHRNEMQISFCLIITIALTLFNKFFFIGIIAYWIFFANFITFTIIFFRNLIIKLYSKKPNKIRW